jgi:hypothetical protein
MKKILGLIVVLGLAASPTLAQKVTIDYAHEFDFEKVKTFQYVDTQESDMSDSLMDERIEKLIREKLVAGGLTEVEEDPDLYVTYHTASKENQVFNTTHFGYGGWGPGWGGWGGYYGGWGGMGMSTSTTTASTYVEGTLIIDAYEPEEKKMVWRGMGTVTVKAKPEKQVKQIENILTKLGKKWDRILHNKGK